MFCLECVSNFGNLPLGSCSLVLLRDEREAVLMGTLMMRRKTCALGELLFAFLFSENLLMRRLMCLKKFLFCVFISKESDISQSGCFWFVSGVCRE
jgi:hypothetical protein